MNAIDDIQAKYTTALSAITADGGWVEWPAVRLALRLAIADGYALGSALADGLASQAKTVGHVSNVTDQRVAESAINQIGQLNEWLSENEPALYASPAFDTARSILIAIRRIAYDLEAAIAERDSLRQQLTQMDADNAGLIAEIDRLTRQNTIAVDTFNSLAETHVNGAAPGNGNGVDPTPAALSANAWSRNHPAWEGLPKADLDVIDQLNGGLTTFRRLSATLRRDLIGRVLRHLATDGYLRQHDYATQKPGWMATATAIARYAPDYQWQTLLAEVMAEPA